MKTNRHLTYSIALSQYNRYKRKYQKLFHKETKQTNKLELLKKRIARLYEFLMERVKTAKLVTAGGALGLMLMSPTAKAQAPSFAAVQKNPFGLADAGKWINPAFVDLDADGDLDIFVGDWNGDLFTIINTGTTTAPAYATAVSSGTGPYNASPAFVDLDNDGDMDMMIGDYYGNFYFYDNTGSATVADFSTGYQQNPFGLAKLTYATAPSFADVDNDGDKDIIAGDYYGNFNYYENTGTATAPAFGAAQENTFGLTAIGYFYTHPTMADLDNDGDIDLLSGSSSADFMYFENIGTASTANFSSVAVNPYSLTNLTAASGIATDAISTPVFGDLDNDGDMDLMAGDSVGNFFYFQNTMINVGISKYSAKDSQISVYPNPNNGIFTIKTSIAGEYIIVNSLGQTVQSFKLNGTNNYTNAIENLDAGVYFVVNTSNKESKNIKIVVTK